MGTAALLLCACADGASIVTDDEAVAADVTATAESGGTSEGQGIESDDGDMDDGDMDDGDGPAVEQVAFGLEILPLLEDKCASCHAPGGPGATHMELATAADAAGSAFAIGRLVEAGIMPPWPASDLSVPFLGDHSLTEDEIAAIVGWSTAGGAVDVDPATPIVSTHRLARIEDPDMVLTSAAGPYQGSTEVRDDYRCLIFDPELTETQWVLRSHFEPDQAEVVHHGIIKLLSADHRDAAEALDAAEPGAGWTCYGGTGLRNAERAFGGWAPGAPPRQFPDGYAQQMQPGDFLIVQIHYHFDNAAPADLSRMALDFASDEEVAAAGGAFKRLRGQLYLGPAEIPCRDGDPHVLCDRDAALERVVDLYGEFVAALPDYFNHVCGARPQDYAHMTDGTAWSTCDLPVKNPGRIVSLGAHMHELGESIRLTLNPDTDEERILLDIPDWQFEWQFGYQPVEDIVIDADDIIRVDCAWNRDNAPYEAVGYILWADGTGDEMCYTSITTAPID